MTIGVLPDMPGVSGCIYPIFPLTDSMCLLDPRGRRGSKPRFWRKTTTSGSQLGPSEANSMDIEFMINAICDALKPFSSAKLRVLPFRDWFTTLQTHAEGATGEDITRIVSSLSLASFLR